MKEEFLILGLPLDTWIIVGGLYIIATFLPTFVAFVLNRRRKGKNE
ncbi:hypothetical protein [Sinanaerobacter chloroacetimidivorans]|uniref:Uncharacterized protein n=1 Tax=Sinanaerobacter chloroacetimidivorans TaxID=2818044 RepID=A0A8J7W1J4_9FIRM|nr:hypothetical protein [Sinanaerobacter chloroacetimidivorans]MBR0598699.1 hypothetical protein [Sinanaerobacter chloroacetimidivorans]